MPEWKAIVVAHVRGMDLSLHELLQTLKLRGQLTSLIAAAVVEKVVAAAAAKAGIRVGDAELQQAADRFRYRHGLTKAEQTRGWLDQNGLTTEDLEERLASELLVEKFKDHLARARLVEHFAACKDQYVQARLRLIVVPTEDLARELLAQITAEGC